MVQAKGYGHIRLVMPYELQSLSRLDIVQEAGEHARLLLTGIIPEEMRDSYIEQASSSDQVEVYVIEEGGADKPIFKGVVSEISVQTVRGIYYLELQGVSYTSLLDLKLHTRSFQDASMSYERLIDQVIGAYDGSDCIDYASNASVLGGFTLQYLETDWQFLKRMASHFGAVLVPEKAANAPKFYFGLPEGRRQKLDDEPFIVDRRLSQYRTLKAYGGGGQEADFTCYTVVTEKEFALGDKVLFQGGELAVVACISRLSEGVLKHEVVLAPEQGIRQRRLFNEKMIGAALQGKIIEVSGTQVKVHLDIDGSQSANTACLFPYASVYTAEGNSGFYCMPQTGDSVKLYIPSAKEADALAISSVRTGGSASPKMADPSTKYWGTNHGKELMFGGDAVSLTAKEGSLFIKLDQSEGIQIQSDKTILFHSDEEMEIESETKLELKAQEAIYFLCQDSSVVMDGNTDIVGNQIDIVGLTKGPVTVEPLPAEMAAVTPPIIAQEAEVLKRRQEEAEKEKGGFWGKLLDGVQLALDVVGLIPGVGEIADLANAGISLARGDYAGAALSLAAMIPFAGAAATGAKFAKKGMDAFSAGKKMMDGASRAVDAVKSVVNSASAAVGKVMVSARSAIESLDELQAIKKLKDSMKETLMKAQEGLDRLANAMPMGRVQTASGAPIGSIGRNQADEVLPKTEVQQNYLAAMREAEQRAARGGGGAPNLHNKNLTPDQEKYYRKKIDDAEARGDMKAADDARYERHEAERRSIGEEPIDREDWDILNERLRKNRERGRVEEENGRNALKNHLGRELEDNNSNKVVTHTSSEGHVTRPDSIGRNKDKEIDLVHDHKHKTGGEDQVVYNDEQMRAQKEMISDVPNGRHVVTMSSDKVDLYGNPPQPRPSSPLAKDSEIYYTEPGSGKITHKWTVDKETGDGYWEEL
ncbi:contractile injection system protein, VgrG/Pvc8 family [Marinicrinis lubricantis]|uniref:Contractile injection system protein, VgrG/Pvc8 family n=1 Tax=Marinicrinis lubricantis TaxID=2086470 RepID=A0ABW1IRV9_9BACL